MAAGVIVIYGSPEHTYNSRDICSLGRIKSHYKMSSDMCYPRVHFNG